jgi:hypothetical protein
MPRFPPTQPIQDAGIDMATSGMPRYPPPTGYLARARHAEVAAVPISHDFTAVPVGSQSSGQLHLVLFSAGALVAVVALVTVIVALNSRKPSNHIEQIPSFSAQDPTELV